MCEIETADIKYVSETRAKFLESQHTGDQAKIAELEEKLEEAEGFGSTMAGHVEPLSEKVIALESQLKEKEAEIQRLKDSAREQNCSMSRCPNPPAPHSALCHFHGGD